MQRLRTGLNEQTIMNPEIKSRKLLLSFGLKRQGDGMCYWNITRVKAVRESDKQEL